MTEFHPLASLFPMIEGEEEIDALAEDIRANGVREPIVLYEGKILDGRNRYLAALDVGIDCPTEEYTGTDPAGYVISLNLHRRHLTDRQRAHIAAELVTARRGGDRPTKEEAAKGPVGPIEMTIDQAAEALKTSPRSTKRARKVMKEDPEAHELAKAGKLPRRRAGPTVGGRIPMTDGSVGIRPQRSRHGRDGRGQR